MIDDQFIFGAKLDLHPPSSQLPQYQPRIPSKPAYNFSTMTTAPLVDHSTQATPPTSIQATQVDLSAADIQAMTLRFQHAEMALTQKDKEIGECEAVTLQQRDKLTESLVRVQARIQRLGAVIGLERVYEGGESREAQGNKYFDIEEVQAMVRGPIRRGDIAKGLERYEHEHEYIQGLQLSQIVPEVFKTLERSLTKVHEHIEGSPSMQKLTFNYEMLQGITAQRDYLDHFSGRFSRFINQVLSLQEYIKEKEKIHLTQIESLACQNQVLFEENCSLQKQIQHLKLTSSTASLIPAASHPKSDEQITLKLQKKIVKEICMLHRSKLEDLKSALFSDLPMASPALPTLHAVPLEDKKIFNFLNANFEIIDSLKNQLRQRQEEAKHVEDRLRERHTETLQNYSVFKKAFDKMVQKHLPRCRVLLKIDAEYIRSTTQREKESLDQAIKKYCSESGTGINDSFSRPKPSLVSNDSLLPNLNVLNILKCHEQLVSKIDELMRSVLP